MNLKRTHAFDVFALTDCGYTKEQNEDSMFVSEDNLIIALADGMGGEPYGEVASALAVRALEEMWREEAPQSLPEDEHADWIDRAFDFANESILRHAEKDTHTYGMGTTLVAAVLTPGGATIGNVGDSRAIIIDGPRGNTITRDHTADAEDALFDFSRRGKRRSGLTRRLGLDYSVPTDIFSVAVTPGSTLLLCTDGLHGVVVLDEIIEIVKSSHDAEDCCHALIATALEYGGPDNVSVIVWRSLSS